VRKGGGGGATGLEHDINPSHYIAVVLCLTVYRKTEQVNAAVTGKPGTQGLVV